MSVMTIGIGRAVIGCLPLLLAGAVGCTHSAVGNRAPLCGCLDPLDSVVDGRCLRLQSTCNNAEDCAQGYSCTPEGKCYCREAEICGVACSDDCSCPENYSCDASLAVCRPSAFCLDDSMCEPGQLCRRHDHIGGYVCQSFSGNQVGEPCEENDDCRTGVCYTNVCLQTCHTNAGCPEGQVCGTVGNEVAVCVVESECSGCALDTQFCMRWSCAQGCRTSADCEGDCYVSGPFPLFGECADWIPAACAADEFTFGFILNEGHCVIYESCWYDADCPAGYQCYDSDELHAGSGAYSAFCARRL